MFNRFFRFRPSLTSHLQFMVLSPLTVGIYFETGPLCAATAFALGAYIIRDMYKSRVLALDLYHAYMECQHADTGKEAEATGSTSTTKQEGQKTK